MKIPFLFLWQLKQDAEERGMTLDAYVDSLIEKLAAEAGMSVEDYMKSVVERAEKIRVTRIRLVGTAICVRFASAASTA